MAECFLCTRNCFHKFQTQHKIGKAHIMAALDIFMKNLLTGTACGDKGIQIVQDNAHGMVTAEKNKSNHHPEMHFTSTSGCCRWTICTLQGRDDPSLVKPQRIQTRSKQIKNRDFAELSQTENIVTIEPWQTLHTTPPKAPFRKKSPALLIRKSITSGSPGLSTPSSSKVRSSPGLSRRDIATPSLRKRSRATEKQMARGREPLKNSQSKPSYQ
jgi:hypothetical protein